MKIIGLTGATGAGKGVFGKNAVQKYNIMHIDTDLTARSVVEPGKPCLEEIEKEFGKQVIKENGTLDRATLGNIVFSDAQKLEVLNRITHHYITKEVEKCLEKAEEEDGFIAAIIDAPLLFESGEDKLCDVTVGIVADKEIRKKRIIVRDGISEEMAQKRLDSGKDTGFFAERCDYLIENNSDETEFLKSCDMVLERILSF